MVMQVKLFAQSVFGLKLSGCLVKNRWAQNYLSCKTEIKVDALTGLPGVSASDDDLLGGHEADRQQQRQQKEPHFWRMITLEGVVKTFNHCVELK